MSGIKGGCGGQKIQCQDPCKNPCQKITVCKDPCQNPCKPQGQHHHQRGNLYVRQQDPCNPCNPCVVPVSCCPDPCDPCQGQGSFCCD
ncbi:outer dense fiber protein 1-like [Rana temporaria]|uniref:outer dense fiber protein 1-like n=1 Tax=Rana temporaria TaxID=8407 RepID=UPI001AAD96A1|nr:outer dense fiber protein 1-like [Rana temporaria]